MIPLPWLLCLMLRCLWTILSQCQNRLRKYWRILRKYWRILRKYQMILKCNIEWWKCWLSSLSSLTKMKPQAAVSPVDHCQHNISQSVDAEEAFCCINLILICIKMKLISFTFAAAIFIQSPCLPVSIPAGGSLPIGEVQPLSFQSTDLTTLPFGTVLTNQSNESQLIPKCALVQFNTEPVCLSMRLNQFWRDTNAPSPRPWNYIFQRTDIFCVRFLSTLKN